MDGVWRYAESAGKFWERHRRVIAILLFIVLVSTYVYASGSDRADNDADRFRYQGEMEWGNDRNGVSQQEDTRASTADDKQTKSENGHWGNDMLSRLVAGFFNGLAAGIEHLPGFKRIDALVFPRIPELGAPADKVDKDLEFWGFYSRWEWNKILFWHNTFRTVAILPVLIQLVILVGAYRVMLQRLSPQKNASMQDDMFGIIMAILFLGMSIPLIKILFELNLGIVDFIKNVLASGRLGVQIDVHADRFWQPITNGTGSALLDSILHLVWAGLGLYINVLYFIRNFLVAVLIIIMPWLAWLWASRGSRTALMLALSELVTNIIMSASHAIVIAVYLTLVVPEQTALGKTVMAGLFSSAWAKIVLMILIPSMGQFIRNLLAGWFGLLGANEERWAATAMAGLGGLMALGTIAGAAVGRSPGRVPWPSGMQGGSSRATGPDHGGGQGGGANNGSGASQNPPAVRMGDALPVPPEDDPAKVNPETQNPAPRKYFWQNPGWATVLWNVGEGIGGFVGRAGGEMAGLAVPGLRQTFGHAGERVGRGVVAAPRKMIDLIGRWQTADGPR
ncbi:MAG: hypothetical protein QW835_04295 [Candidatus Hadarchaeum sp.]